MAELTPQQITKAGIAPSYAAVSASDTIRDPSAGMFLQVKNASGTVDTVTLTDSGTTSGGSAATSPTITVPITTGDRMIYIPPQFVAAATGLITVTHSQTASVTQALFRVV